MRPLHRAALIAMSAIPALASIASAQGTTPFRPRQWGAEFTGTLNGIGLLRFSDPQHAWVLDLGFNLNNSSISGNTADNTTLNVHLGRRHYGALVEHVVWTRTLGVMGSYANASTHPGGVLATDETDWGAGVFGSLGAQWLVTPHFSVGADWTASLGWTHTHATNNPPNYVNGHNINFSLGGVRLLGAVYF